MTIYNCTDAQKSEYAARLSAKIIFVEVLIHK